ncbi:MAG: cytidine deaminase [Steroidobacteraceae bacterium]
MTTLIPPALLSQLHQAILDNKGMLPGALAGQVMKDSDLIDVGPLMISLLPFAAAYARVPISNYPVGAVALGMPTGSPIPNMYLGANVEFTGEALSFTVHAEQSATTNAWLNGEQGIQALAISAAPCGYCRQFLYELVTAQALDILLPQQGSLAPATSPLTVFLPDAFGPQDLGLQGGLMTPQQNGLTLASPDPLVQAALTAANTCYAPYTKNFAGIALLTPTNTVYVGQYGENAAYNPSMSPLESAVTFMNMSQAQGAPMAIKRVVLVESPTTASQKDATVSVLSSFAPSVQLEYHAVR